MARVLKYSEVLDRLKKGEGIHWTDGIDNHFFMMPNETVRHDTVTKLYKQGLITRWGFPELHGIIRYAAPVS